jgi:hypothetical protein
MFNASEFKRLNEQCKREEFRVAEGGGSAGASYSFNPGDEAFYGAFQG